jgi:hypothetical protein
MLLLLLLLLLGVAAVHFAWALVPFLLMLVLLQAAFLVLSAAAALDAVQVPLLVLPLMRPALSQLQLLLVLMLLGSVLWQVPAYLAAALLLVLLLLALLQLEQLLLLQECQDAESALQVLT